MVEREPFEDALLIAEAAGREVETTLTLYQEANLVWWDGEIDRLEQNLKKDRPKIAEEVERRNKSDAYMRRTINKI